MFPENLKEAAERVMVRVNKGCEMNGKVCFWRQKKEFPRLKKSDSGLKSISARTAYFVRKFFSNRVKGCNSPTGFTLIELIVVLTIISIIFGMSVPFFAKFTKGSKLKNAAANIGTVLRTARSYAVTKRKNHLVIINDKQDAGLYYAVKIYQTGDDAKTIDKWHEFPQGIEIDRITGFSNADVPFPYDISPPVNKPVIEFKPNGGAKQNGSIYIKDSDNKYKQIIVIGTTGRVKISDEAP